MESATELFVKYHDSKTHRQSCVQITGVSYTISIGRNPGHIIRLGNVLFNLFTFFFVF